MVSTFRLYVSSILFTFALLFNVRFDSRLRFQFVYVRLGSRPQRTERKRSVIDWLVWIQRDFLIENFNVNSFSHIVPWQKFLRQN